MNTEDKETNTSVWGGFSFAVPGTIFCALPIVLVTLGMGGVVAAIVIFFTIRIAARRTRGLKPLILD